MDTFESSIPDYGKVISIINSCKTLEQLKYAERYVELFEQHYDIDENEDINKTFKKTIFSKKMKLKNGWNNKN